MPEQDIKKLKAEIENLKKELRHKEQTLRLLLNETENYTIYNKDFCTFDIERYSRQMLVPQIGVEGQKALKNSKVLVVGAGGLGCPASIYLAATGVGELSIIDYDTVEVSNLHRQILHTESDIGAAKADSIQRKLTSINRGIRVIQHNMPANVSTMKYLLARYKYDVIVDGSDNVATRYLLNDICVLHNIPLVSGSALQMEGQLTVYHYKDGPCYRCLFPVPPPPETVTNCGDGGVVGPVPGVIGVLQALETIKILTKMEGILSGKLLLFDGETTSFRNVKIRQRSQKCEICGDKPTITDLIDYTQFCGSNMHDKVTNINILTPDDQIDVEEFYKVGNNRLILDVRPEIEFKMCSLPESINYPYSRIAKGDLDELISLFNKRTDNYLSVMVLCRRGNDSQRALKILKEYFTNKPIAFFNVKGGLHKFSNKVDSTFPVY